MLHGAQMPRIKLAHPTLERTNDTAWLRAQIKSLANNAEAELTRRREWALLFDDAAVREARADTAKHYAAELRRILRGLTWEEDFADRVHKSDPKLARKIARHR